MRLLLTAFLCLLLLPAGVLADEDKEEGAAPPAPPAGGGGRRAGPRGGMLERLKQMDANGDGTITREEFRGPARFFDRVDANGDGELTSEEIERAANRGGRSGRRGQSGGLTPGAVDTDRDNKVSKAELDQWFEKADQNGDGFVDAPEWTAALSGRALRDPAPQVGALAPKVKAKRLGKDEHVDLAKVERITVLIFGSHT